jgi:hypothetical protein
MDCDQIMVLDRGEAVDIGPHRELVERCALYRRLWLQQNRQRRRRCAVAARRAGISIAGRSGERYTNLPAT